MTPRQRVLAAMRRTNLQDRCPFEISWGAFTPGLMKVYRDRTGSALDPCEHFDFDTRSVDLAPTRKQTDFRRFYPNPVPDNVVFDEWGVGMVPGPLEHFVEFKYHPLAACETPDQVLDFAWPDVDADYRFEPLAAKVADFQARGYAVTGELYQTIFEMAWLLRGMETLLVDFLADPDLAHAICGKLTDLRVRQAVRYAELGVDILRLGDDVGTQTGPMIGMDTYRTFLKQRTGRIIAAAKRVKPDLLVFMHCDGQVAGFIPEYLEIGVDILNPLQPECNDLAAIGRQYGDRLSFWGGIGTQSTMPFGTPGDVERKVREVQAALGSRGGLLLAPTHILEPEVPWENIEAFVAAAKSARSFPAASSDLSNRSKQP
jgi:uroporphyrinogen decarboxylase